MKPFQVSSILVWSLALSLALLFSSVKSNQDVCRSSQVIMSKFFVLNELVFFTANPDHFDSMSIFNLSSGSIRLKVKASSLIPNLAFQSAQGPENILWAFQYDVRMSHCEPHKLKGFVDESRTYCARVGNLKGLVVARLSSHRLIFMRRQNSHKFMVVNEQSDFLEIKVVVKHLDETEGITNSLTFDQKTDQFVSTHYGSSNLCITSVHHESIKVPLPLVTDILNERLFETSCHFASQTYTSVIDLHDYMYGLTSSGMVDRFILSNLNSFDKKESSSVKTFLNCFGNSSAIGHFNKGIFDLTFEDVPAKSEKPAKQKAPNVAIQERSGDDKEGSSGLGALLFTIACFGSVFLIACLCITGIMTPGCCCRMCTGSVSGAVKGAIKGALFRGKSKNRKKKRGSKTSSIKSRSSSSSLRSKKSRKSNKSRISRKDSKRSKKSTRSGESRKSRKSRKSKKSKKSAGKDSKKLQNKSDTSVQKLAQVIANSGIARTISQSLGQLGKQFGDTIAKWRSSQVTAPLSKFEGDSWTDSETFTSPTDDTENGGVELPSSSSFDTEQGKLTAEHTRNDGDLLEPRVATDGDTPNVGDKSQSEKQEVVLQIEQQEPSLLTSTSSSLLSSEDEFVSSDKSAQLSSVHKHSTDAMVLAKAISSMLDQYKQSKANNSNSSKKVKVASSSSSSSSPSIPHLLNSDEFSLKKPKEESRVLSFSSKFAVETNSDSSPKLEATSGMAQI